MKLQILVPQYNEDEKVIRPLLDSLALQQDVDFSEFMVIICNDGSGVYLSQEFIESYPFQIVYMSHIKNCGTSATRNTLMDVATADYIMFCDADDLFLNVFGLWTIFKAMEQGFDLYVPPFTEETRDKNGKPYFVTHNKDGVFVHGKVYNLQWLKDEKIRWDEDLRVHEDSYFNLLCYNLADKKVDGEMIYYCWKWRDESICRSDDKYLLKTYDQMIESSDRLVAEFMRRERHEEARYYAAFMLYDIYFLMNKEQWLFAENLEHRDRVEKRFKQYYIKWRDLIEAIEEGHKRKIIREIRERMYKEGMYLEAMTFADWMRHIEYEVSA